MASSSEPAPDQPARRGRWRTVAVVLVLLVVGAWCARGAVLRWLGARLVADQDPGRFDLLWIVDEDVDRRYDLAAELHRQTGCRIAVAKSVGTRMVQLGIEPSNERLAQRELRRRGLPDNALVTVGGPTGPEWPEDRLLADWLRQHPQVRVLVVCERFRSAAHRAQLDELLGPKDAGRVAVRGIRDRRFDETNWWQSRVGAKAFFVTWLSCRRGRHPLQADADHYEQAFLRQLGVVP
jgi:hypothetical protein